MRNVEMLIYDVQNKEIAIFHVHNEDKCYNLHGVQCRNLDI